MTGTVQKTETVPIATLPTLSWSGSGFAPGRSS